MLSPAMPFLAASIGLYAVEYFWTVDYFAGIAAAILLSGGSAWIDSGVPKGLAAALGLFAGLVIAWLCRTAKRARLSKIHDL